MEYTLLDGQRLALDALTREDLAYLFDLARRASEGEEQGELHLAVKGRDAYPLKGAPGVSAELSASTLFRVAEDIAFRASIRQGTIRPAPGESAEALEGVIGVTEAASQIGISRAAVVNAANRGRIQGRKIGGAWALLESSVRRYKVAEHYVEAGRSGGGQRRTVRAAKKRKAPKRR